LDSIRDIVKGIKARCTEEKGYLGESRRELRVVKLWKIESCREERRGERETRD